ncbi:MAG: undecaprenyl-diphosphatase UppP [Candidatus Woykebacteria bacterium RBG_13_40_7b]|uniref:Undecaprenyl-diphosphatase n=1 Tax=Candidatus Woykebacteria bacterium RBG_13_40_7b TaxID=1802594 RepID=A0A1G1WA89_9BACT|nr:MAG: undecaprenyl-diphosphatase UppP [Candidatus Woykebacteria bacterium RBG_13_40_7b]
MAEFQALILGIVQGLTEYLPISSSGHLVLVPWLFGWTGLVNSLTFDVSLHAGTTLAVVGFFWKDWLRMIKALFKKPSDFEAKLLLLILAGSIPAGAVGFLFNDFFEKNVRSPLLIALALFGFALLLGWVDKFGRKNRSFAQIMWLDALMVGLAQAVSLIPGVSRSGITVSAGLFQGLNREAAVRFSFLLSTPVILGAAIFSLKDLFSQSNSNGNLLIFILGTLSAAVVGWLTIKFLLKFVQKNGFGVFVWYRIVISLVVVLVYLFRFHP